MKHAIEINGVEYELIYTVSAIEKLEEAMEGTKGGLGEWLKGTPVMVMKRVVALIAILANAKAEKDRVEIAAGLRTGEPQKEINGKDLEKILTPGETMRMRKTALSAISDGLAVELPEEIESKRDYDLEEIEEKNG